MLVNRTWRLRHRNSQLSLAIIATVLLTCPAATTARAEDWQSSWSTATLSQARGGLLATSAGGKVFFGGGNGSNGSSNVVDIYRRQIYDSITSSQVFTLVDQTTVSGQMQLSGPGSLDLGAFDLAVGSMSGDAPINLSGNTLTVGSDNTSAAPYTGAISGGNLIKVGTGQLSAGGQLSADITIDQGRIEAGPGAVVGGNVTIAAGARLTNNGGTLFLDNLTNSGVLDGSAQINGSFVNAAGASVRVGAGERVTLFSASGQINAGVIDVIGNPNFVAGRAVLESDGPLTNAESTGLIAGQNATLRFNGGLTNEGSVALSFGTSNVFGDIANTGNISITGGADVTFYDDVDQQGSLTVSTGGRAAFFGAFTGDGGFTGGGDVYLLGDLRPGNSPADVLMQGNLVLGATTTTQIELGGSTPGTEYDRLSISGDVQFAGSLSVELIDAGGGLFEPSVGDQFVVATYASHSGEFSIESLPTLSQPGAEWQVDYGDEALTLSVAGLTGDVDVDGKVDRRDVAVLLAGYGTESNARWSDGDFDFDRAITLLDLARLQSNLGTQLPSPATAVPEPTTGLMLWLLLLMSIATARSRRQDSI